MDIRKTELVVIDTETTGIDPETDTIVEVAASTYLPKKVDGAAFTKDLKVWKINPEMGIPPGAMSVHHITDEEVANAPIRSQMIKEVVDYVAGRPLVAHNAPFDRGMLPELNQLIWIDTLRFAQHLWPLGTLNEEGDPLPNHKNQTLRHWLGLKLKTGAAHRADADIEVTTGILRHEIEEYLRRGHSPEIEDLVEFIASPRLLPEFPYGKYKGFKIEDVPNDYLRTFIDKDKKGEEIDRDFLYTCQHHYNDRIKKARASL